ncbi:DUF1566 domain-containing protein [Arcobacter sp. LA11]|uniref:Lcl C-terminal domain-containing protein n=1 Tax=Arcobacter sp. LA11 TaxID=1898176 RepID=UPI0009340BC4|nr:DUF1566 domain-containing protein [Arcobacter sp. LA11]
MKYLILLVLFLSFSIANDFRRSGKDAVVDTKNKLMWIDNISVVKTLRTHEEATFYCENLSFLGFTNWRIPKIEEFEFIVDKKNEKNYINKTFRFNVPDGYWAQKAHWRTLWFYADYMHFVSGTPYYDSRHKNKYVRCVRDIR